MPKRKRPRLAAAEAAERVKVVVRCRPLSSTEIEDGRQVVVDIDETAGTVAITKPGASQVEVKSFTFDSTYGSESTQSSIYEETGRPIINAALEGYNGTIFAYGQTGTGKTYTMEGKYDDPDKRGIIPNAFMHIFAHIDNDENTDRQYLVRASYLEIYNEEVRDLLSKTYKRKLQIKQHPEKGVFVKDLSAFVVKDVSEIDQVMRAGKKNRSVGATKMNVDSSRSHSVFTITIECSTKRADGTQHIHVGRLNLVDLAGSERQSKTGAEGDRFTEAVNINLSLSALGNVISALAEGSDRYVPYRDSQLTRLLEDSLGGNSKTVMMANIGPADYNYDETISTLRYANRAKNIKNKPKINEDPKDAMLRQFQEEIDRLKAQLSAAGGAGAVAVAGDGGVPNAMTGSLEGVDDETMKEMELKLEEERARLMADKTIKESERAEAQARLDARAAEIESVRAAHAEKEERLRQLEAQVIVGGTNMFDEVTRQEEALKRAEEEMALKAKLAERLERELAEQDEDYLMKHQQFSSVQEELDVLTKKLKKLWGTLQAARAEVRDLQEEHARDREVLMDEIGRQQNQIKLCRLIVESFVPPGQLEQLMNQCVWSDDRDNYVVAFQPLAGNNVDQGQRTRDPDESVGPEAAAAGAGTAADSSFDRAVAADPSVALGFGAQSRFNRENLKQYEKDLGMGSRPDTARSSANQNTDDDDEFAEAMPNVYLSYSPEYKRSRNAAPATGRGKAKRGKKKKGKKKEILDNALYPDSRGYISINQ